MRQTINKLNEPLDEVGTCLRSWALGDAHAIPKRLQTR